MIGSVTQQQTDVIDLRAENAVGYAEIEGTVAALMRIKGVIAAVLHQVEGRNADSHRTTLVRSASTSRDCWDEKRRDLQVVEIDLPVSETVECGPRLINLLH